MSLRRSLRALGEHITYTVGPGIYRLVGEDAVKLHLENVSGLANDDCRGSGFLLGGDYLHKDPAAGMCKSWGKKDCSLGWGRRAPSLGSARRRRAEF